MAARNGVVGTALRVAEFEYPVFSESREEMMRIAFLLSMRDEIAIDRFPERARRSRERRAERV